MFFFYSNSFCQYYNLFFFFSSRRRHTRWNCDWFRRVLFRSIPLLLHGTTAQPVEDDAVHGAARNLFRAVKVLILIVERAGKGRKLVAEPAHHIGPGKENRHRDRSEERRVGKECRARWWLNDD